MILVCLRWLPSAFQTDMFVFQVVLLVDCLLYIQEPISRVIEGQIISDLRSSLSDVCDVLSSLDIAIGFLASSGGQTETSMRWYLHEVLKLPRDRGLKSPTVGTVHAV